MTQAQQPEAPLLKLAADLDFMGFGWVADVVRQAHAENTALKQGYDAARLEIESLKAEISVQLDALEFVERWAVHHGSKAGTTASEALSVIQHYPPIAEITARYADGKPAETFNPFARIAELQSQLAVIGAGGEYPPLPEWSKMDNLGDLVPSEICQALRDYVDADRAMRAQVDAHNFEVIQFFDHWLLSKGTYSTERTEESDGPMAPAMNWIDSVEKLIAQQAAPAAVAVPSDDVQKKIQSNTWDHFGDILPTLKAISRGEWYWGLNSRCKYIELRIDTRDGGCILYDRDRVRISPEQFAFQAGNAGKMDAWPAKNQIAAAPQPPREQP